MQLDEYEFLLFQEERHTCLNVNRNRIAEDVLMDHWRVTVIHPLVGRNIMYTLLPL